MTFKGEEGNHLNLITKTNAKYKYQYKFKILIKNNIQMTRKSRRRGRRIGII